MSESKLPFGFLHCLPSIGTLARTVAKVTVRSDRFGSSFDAV
jgi:hypothetical protein